MKSIFFYFVLSVVFISVIGCSPKLAKQQTTKGDYIFFPKIKDSAKFQFLTSFSNSLDVIGKQSKFRSSIVGNQEIKQISKPYGVSIKNGKIYVCDVSNRTLEIIDLENKTFNYFIPQGKHVFGLPLNSYTDENDNLYIVDTKKQAVAVFDSNLKFITEFGKGTLVNPTDVFVKHDKIYVVNSKEHRVNIYNKDNFKLIDYFPKTVQGNDDWLSMPTNIFISDQRIYISDLGATNIKIYSIKGEHIKNVGSLGRLSGQFVRPKGVAADKEDNFYVVDGAFENVQVFNKEGLILLAIGGPYNGPGDFYLPTQVHVDYDNNKYFQQYVSPEYKLNYIILVANQYGPEKISVYGRITKKQ